MRILTWNVNVLRTVLDYHPWSSMKNKSVEGLLEELGADVCCFQEHKTRRAQVDKAMACPGPYDAFWTWPRSKTGYSGVCTYVDSRVCVPLRAEEGITGLLLEDKGGAMKPPWTEEEKIGCYPDIYTMDLMDEEDGTAVDPRRLDMEGRAVVCDFGMFVLFNLYCPNETNETRRPYKMNFLHVLEARVAKLMAAGREVIVAGDMNVMSAPIDSREGGIQSTAEQHYAHPARRWFHEWLAPNGPMIDVVRESFPDREDMFTCWNTKIDARPSNYGSRIDYILCSPGLRQWIKGGDIQANLFGSDHCPVYIDLHDSIETEKGTVFIRDLLNPAVRPPSTAPVYPTDVPRTAPEPPRFATKFLEEFSAKQRTLKSLWAKAPASSAPSPSPAPSEDKDKDESQSTQGVSQATSGPSTTSGSDRPLGIARAAFNSLDAPSLPSRSATTVETPASAPSTVISPATSAAAAAGPSKRPITVDLTGDDDDEPRSKKKTVERTRSAPAADKGGKSKSSKADTKKTGGQAKLAAFWSTPAKVVKGPSLPKRKTPSPEPMPDPGPSQFADVDNPQPDVHQDALLAQALADEESERARSRKAKNDEAAPVWSTLFAKKLPPLCAVHQQPCKDFIVKIPGPNKGKRFWLCSLPVGPGYDTGRSSRPRQEVNHDYRCDFFLWDSANSRKEPPKVVKSS